MELIVNKEQLNRLVTLLEQLQVKDKNVKNKKPTLVSTPSNNDGTYIIRKNNPSNVFIIMIGGTPSKSFGAKWMEKQLGDLLADKNVFYSNWENTMDKNLNILQKNYPGATVSSVNGFSKGGLRAYPESGRYGFVGLIDPSIEGNYTSVDIKPNHNTFMIYKPKRGWGEYTLNYAINKLGNNRIYSINIGHLEMPREFVKRFKSKL